MRLHGANTPLEGASAATQAIDSLVTACFLLDRARRGHGEPFDDGIFIFLDDHDFALRTRIAGHRLLSVPEALCWHGAGTLGLSMRDGRRYERRRAFHVICNRWQVLLKSYAPRTLLALAPMLLLFEMVQLAGVVRKGWLREWLAALRWVVAHRGDIAQRRAAVQAERRVSDASILGGGPLPLRDELVLGPLQRAARSIFDRLSSLYWPVARRLL
jgi:GT2 family glycosyltransferase